MQSRYQPYGGQTPSSTPYAAAFWPADTNVVPQNQLVSYPVRTDNSRCGLAGHCGGSGFISPRGVYKMGVQGLVMVVVVGGGGVVTDFRWCRKCGETEEFLPAPRNS